MSMISFEWHNDSISQQCKALHFSCLFNTAFLSMVTAPCSVSYCSLLVRTPYILLPPLGQRKECRIPTRPSDSSWEFASRVEKPKDKIWLFSQSGQSALIMPTKSCFLEPWCSINSYSSEAKFILSLHSFRDLVF